MSLKKKISVIVVIYNIAEYLEQCLESVVNQTYRSLEIILVVGMPPSPASDTGYLLEDDGCNAICSYYAGKDNRIKIVNCRASGVSDARNRGLSAATGDLIGFVDGDDYIEPDMFEHLVALMEDREADIAVTGRFYEFKNIVGRDRPYKSGPLVMTSEEALKMVLSGGGFFLHCWDKLYKAELWKDVSFPIDSYVEDRIVIDHVLASADKLVYDPTPKYHYRERKGGLSKTGDVAANNMEANVKLTDFVARRFPRLSQLCDRFIIYEYITAIQNAYLNGQCDESLIKNYKKELEELAAGCSVNPLITWKLQTKLIVALKAPKLLTLNTKIRNWFINRRFKRYD